MQRLTWMGVVLGTLGCGPPCQEVQADALAQVLAAVDEPTPCNYDSDCTVVGLLGTCFDGCSQVVHEDDAIRYRTAMAEVESTVCVEHEEASCRLAPTPCPQPPENAVCLNGQCLFLPPS